jgi:hypothetical protein
MKIYKFISVCFLVLFSTVCIAQEKEAYMLDKTDWKTFKEYNGVIFSQKTVEYHDNINNQHKEFYLVSMTNTTEVAMEISAKRAIWYEDKCFNCDSDDEEYKIYFRLDAGEEIIGNPVENKHNRLVIFKKFLKYPGIDEVTKFEFQNLTVNPI